MTTFEPSYLNIIDIEAYSAEKLCALFMDGSSEHYRYHHSNEPELLSQRKTYSKDEGTSIHVSEVFQTETETIRKSANLDTFEGSYFDGNQLSPIASAEERRTPRPEFSVRLKVTNKTTIIDPTAKPHQRVDPSQKIKFKEICKNKAQIEKIKSVVFTILITTATTLALATIVLLTMFALKALIPELKTMDAMSKALIISILPLPATLIALGSSLILFFALESIKTQVKDRWAQACFIQRGAALIKEEPQGGE